jgi:hypothetical protein
MNKKPPVKVSKKVDQSTPLSSPMPINFWQEHMASIWIIPGANIGCHIKAIFVDPFPEKVLVFSEIAIGGNFLQSMTFFPGLEILPLYLLGLVAADDWTILFFSLSSNLTPNSVFLGSLKCFVRDLQICSFFNLANFFQHCLPTIGQNRICQLFLLM